MKISLIALAAMVALPLAAYAQETPEIRVSDGKVSITALSVPIGRLLQLLDRAVGMKSEVLKPELTNRLVSVRFTNLELKDAVYKIFQGQNLNYLMIEGKGIRVTDAAQGGGTTSTVSTPSSPFQDQQPIVNNPIPINPQPQPIQANVPVAQPAQPANPFGTQPNAQPANTAAPGAGFVPGQLPPPIGASNPLATPANTGAPSVGFPSTPAAPPQPAGPGVLPAGPGALPGATVPGQIGR